jgi:hypothetical protein
MGTLKLPKHSWLSIEMNSAKTLRLHNWIYSFLKTNHAQQLVMLLSDAVDDYSLLELMLAAATGATLHNASRLLHKKSSVAAKEIFGCCKRNLLKQNCKRLNLRQLLCPPRAMHANFGDSSVKNHGATSSYRALAARRCLRSSVFYER